MLKLPIKLMHSYWRRTRGLTLGAQSAVIDEAGRFLLIRHSYRPGWHFPGGGVERGESLSQAMARELQEEAGVTAVGSPTLHGIFDNGAQFPGDHIAVFIVRDWHQNAVPKPNAEIRAQGFFFANDVPDGTSQGTHRRIAEIASGTPPSVAW